MKIPEKKIFSRTLSLALLALVLFVGYKFKHTFIKHIATINLYWFAAGILSFLLNYVARAFRLIVIAPPGLLSFLPSMQTVSIHGVLTYLLPFKTGEISLPLLLRKQGLELQSSVHVLLKCRLLDISSLGSLLIISLIFFSNNLNIESYISFFILGIILIFSSKIIKIIVNISPRKLIIWLENHISTVNGLSTFNIREYILSIIVWFSIAMSLYCIIKALHLNLSIADTLCLVSIQLPLQLLPLQGLANAGNHEASWLAGLALFGLTPTESIGFALSSHILLTCYIIFMGIIALILHIINPMFRNAITKSVQIFKED